MATTLDKLDMFLLCRVDGKRWRSEVEFEEQTRLRSLTDYGVRWTLDAGTVRVDWSTVSGGDPRA